MGHSQVKMCLGLLPLLLPLAHLDVHVLSLPPPIPVLHLQLSVTRHLPLQAQGMKVSLCQKRWSLPFSQPWASTSLSQPWGCSVSSPGERPEPGSGTPQPSPRLPEPGTSHLPSPCSYPFSLSAGLLGCLWLTPFKPPWTSWCSGIMPGLLWLGRRPGEQVGTFQSPSTVYPQDPVSSLYDPLQWATRLALTWIIAVSILGLGLCQLSKSVDLSLCMRILWRRAPGLMSRTFSLSVLVYCLSCLFRSKETAHLLLHLGSLLILTKRLLLLLHPVQPLHFCCPLLLLHHLKAAAFCLQERDLSLGQGLFSPPLGFQSLDPLTYQDLVLPPLSVLVSRPVSSPVADFIWACKATMLTLVCSRRSSKCSLQLTGPL